MVLQVNVFANTFQLYTLNKYNWFCFNKTFIKKQTKSIIIKITSSSQNIEENVNADSQSLLSHVKSKVYH